MLIGQRVRRINWRQDRGNKKADSVDTVHHLVKKINYEAFTKGVTLV
jgi:hypothetical protein